MPKYSQRNTQGCTICGDPSVGRGIQVHVKQRHDVEYASHLKCYSRTVTVRRLVV